MNVIIHPSAKKFAPDGDLHGASIRPVEKFLPFVSEAERELLKKEFPNGKLYTRGALLGNGEVNLPTWEKIAPGDLAVFFRDKAMVGSGTVVLKIRSVPLSRAIDGIGDSPDGSPFELIYVVKDLREQSTPKSEVQQQLCYGLSDQVRFIVVKDPEVASRFIQWIAGLDVPSEVELREMYDSPEFESTDRLSTLFTRREPSYWRKVLFKKSLLGTCHICRNVMPVKYLVDAHVKPRHRCNLEERLDRHNMIAACLFGCDALFERRALFVKDGIISAQMDLLDNSFLKAQVGNMVGKRCERWNTDSAKYFAAHNEMNL